ncbi:class I SAM-dependent methyltransferase [Actomonas aquatica]|uniref:Class I SAM-dependent methyltransferase n=1 Tax=Actomonas aquatica TaxID=2866162 RepID=A0ABZ1CB50_9BACT|nr:class I SAM-dependent methyltransferase [Opitutus sp. WL0086]WRQ88776.1 class I SAM-dependent methyltransferase [Opitutus sp. WL0086]
MPDSHSTDPKQGEREYYAQLGDAAIAHAIRKPFSDENCAFNLANLAALFHLLPPPPLRILHLGCGVGWLSHMLAERGYHVTGIDIAPEAIAAATRRRDEAGLTDLVYQLGDYEDAINHEPYDVVLFYDALHHAEEPSRALTTAAAALRPGGKLIAFEPGEGHHDSAKSQQAIANFGVHEADMPPARIIALGHAAGFSRHQIMPHPADLMAELYHPDYAVATDQIALARRQFDRSWQLVRELWREPRRHAFTVLWK